MFDALKAAGALAGLMKNKDAIRDASDRIQARLDTLRAVGQSGGGAVRVTATGKLRIERVELSPALCASLAGPPNANVNQHAESLIADAVNDALSKAQDLAQREVAREAETMGLKDIPGLDKILS